MAHTLKITYELIKKHLNERYEKQLDIQHVRQPSSDTCWAACYKMIDDWAHDRDSAICHFVRLQTQNCGGCNRPTGYCNKPRYTDKVTSDWRSLGYLGTRHEHGPLSLSEIRHAIKHKRPVQAFMHFRGKAVGHFFIIQGTTRKFSADTALVIANPAKDQILEIDSSALGKEGDWQESWIISK